MTSKSSPISALQAFLRGELSIAEIEDALKDVAAFRLKGPAIRAIMFREPFSAEIEIRPVDVERMLVRYLNGEIDAHTLSQWAIFIILSQAYHSRENEDDEDYYEPMWRALQMLSTPELDGEITRERVNEFLLDVRKLDPIDGTAGA